MHILIKSLILAVLISGCSVENLPDNKVVTIQNSVVGDVISDGNGYKYRKLTEEKLTNGIGRIDIWERIDPLVTNKWYTPSLSSRIHSNSVEFNSLYRGEEKP